MLTCVYITLLIEPGPVNMLTVSQTLSASELRLSWTQSSENNCRETGYEIQYSLINKDQCQMVREGNEEWLTLSRTTATSITIQGLLPHSTYSVSVRAFNDAGLGEASLGIQTTTHSGKSFRNK